MRRNPASRSAAAAAALLVVLALGGCSILTGTGPTQQAQSPGSSNSASTSDGSSAESAALDQMVQAAQSQIPTVKASYGDTYSDITVKAVHPNTIVYTTVYSKQLDAAATAANFDARADTIQKSCDTQVFPAMKAGGITSGQHATYTYLNADGSRIWSRTFSPSN
jgi:hypothetical protein